MGYLRKADEIRDLNVGEDLGLWEELCNTLPCQEVYGNCIRILIIFT